MTYGTSACGLTRFHMLTSFAELKCGKSLVMTCHARMDVLRAASTIDKRLAHIDHHISCEHVLQATTRVPMGFACL